MGRDKMTTSECKANYLLGKLRDRDKSGKGQNLDIVLFLGAGINQPKSTSSKKSSSWEGLLGKILKHAIYYSMGDIWSNEECKSALEWIKSETGLSFYEQASLAKRLLGNQYLHTVQQKLYQDVHPDFPGERDDARYLHAVADICQLPCVRAVVTYNYDDFVEALLKSQKREPISVFGDDMSVSMRGICPPTKIPIYHVHGFLPRVGNMADFEESGFVLCYEEYYRNLLEPYSWQNVQQLSFLRTCVSLYMGVSLKDMNMLRLLYHAGAYARENNGYMICFNRIGTKWT